MPAQLTEKWLPIPGFAGFYEISTSGRVYSLPRGGTAGGYVYPWRGRSGRLQVRLSKYGRTQVLMVGVLVLLTHSRTQRPSPCARPCYQDGDITNNSLSNLSWTQWPRARKPARRGETVHTARLTAAIVARCRRRYRQGTPQKVLCAEYGVSSASMSHAIHGVTWKYIIDPPAVPRTESGRRVYARSAEGRAQRRRQAAITNQIRYGTGQAVTCAGTQPAEDE